MGAFLIGHLIGELDMTVRRVQSFFTVGGITSALEEVRTLAFNKVDQCGLTHEL
jgi:hypothetical protein